MVAGPQSLPLPPSSGVPTQAPVEKQPGSLWEGKPWPSPYSGQRCAQYAGWVEGPGPSFWGKAQQFLHLSTSVCPKPHLQGSQLLSCKDQFPVALITRAPFSCLLPTTLPLSLHG